MVTTSQEHETADTSNGQAMERRKSVAYNVNLLAPLLRVTALSDTTSRKLNPAAKPESYEVLLAPGVGANLCATSGKLR